jgi:hypothetical protein
MLSKKTLIVLATFVAALGPLGTTAPTFAASREKVLYSFCPTMKCTDGTAPFAGVIMDIAGTYMVLPRLEALTIAAPSSS